MRPEAGREDDERQKAGSESLSLVVMYANIPLLVSGCREIYTHIQMQIHRLSLSSRVQSHVAGLSHQENKTTKSFMKE